MSVVRRSLVCLAFAASPLAAGDLWVTRYDDPVPDGCLATDCSLREAVIEANADADFDSIRLPAGTYVLTRSGTNEDAAATGDLDLTSDLELGGPAASMTTVNANAVDRVFHVLGTGVNAVLHDLTIRGGVSAVAGNGISLTSGAELDVLGCEIRDNTSTGSGISIGNNVTLTLRDSLLTNNGGGGLNLQSTAHAELENVTFTDDLTSEILINGGGTSVTCRHCTLGRAGGVLLVNGSNTGSATFANSIVSGTCTFINGGTMTSLGGNVESSGNTCGFGEGDDQSSVTGADLALASLGDNGGGTRSRLPGVSSSAVNAGRDAESLTDDQRAADRPSVDVDSGALELEAVRPPTPLFFDGFEQGSPGAWIVP